MQRTEFTWPHTHSIQYIPSYTLQWHWCSCSHKNVCNISSVIVILVQIPPLTHTAFPFIHPIACLSIESHLKLSHTQRASVPITVLTHSFYFFSEHSSVNVLLSTFDLVFLRVRKYLQHTDAACFLCLREKFKISNFLTFEIRPTL